MRRNLALGAWYALVLAAVIAAEDRLVSSKEAPLMSEASSFGEVVGSVSGGDRVEVTGPAQDGFVPVKVNGKAAWICESDLYTAKEEEKLKKTTGAGSAEAAAQEGAYVKGFDPEVEEQYRKDNPDLDKVYQQEVLPWVYGIRGNATLEQKEEALEKLQIQAKGNTPEANRLREEIESLKKSTQPLWDSWASRLREFRKQGQIGEFAGSH